MQGLPPPYGWMANSEVPGSKKRARDAYFKGLAPAPSSEQKASAKGVHSSVRSLYHKTVLCSFFPKGLCKKGKACTFAHNGSELEEAPDLRKTSICLAWKRGCCTLSSSECAFAHGRRDLRLTWDNS